MLRNVFLFKGTKFCDLEDLNIYSYPDEVIKINQEVLVNNIINNHNKDNLIQNAEISHFNIDEPIAQSFDELNIYSVCVNREIIVGLIFEDDDNPYDYNEILQELLNELFNNGIDYSLDDELEIDNFLISMFIDIRRFGDEVVERTPDIEYYYQKETFFKIFVFGIDETGKSSLVRRLKTGQFNENFFTPTRKFNIEYLPVEEKGLLALWDMPGQKAFRSKWLLGLQDSNLIVYMIDIANQRRFEESKKEFWQVINNEELREIPLLILGNKIDLVKASKDNREKQLQNLKDELFKLYKFGNIKNRKWKFVFTSVKTNFNIDELIPMIFELISS